jgi:hypothetical protein
MTALKQFMGWNPALFSTKTLSVPQIGRLRIVGGSLEAVAKVLMIVSTKKKNNEKKHFLAHATGDSLHGRPILCMEKTGI